MRGALLAVALAFAARAATGQGLDLARTIEREVEMRAEPSALWPGFEPLVIPLAIYTGDATYLYRHPSPPAGFVQIDGAEPAVARFAGRYPAVTANSSAEIGGSMTATLQADAPHAQRDAAELAATALHEAFHVYQRRRHPSWTANEADLFLYPADDARLLAWRRLESQALSRALAASDRGAAACWTRRAIGFRRQRFANMEAAFAAYERASELNEGLAAYVQLLAAGRRTVAMPAAEFSAAAVRERVYVSGPAWAFLLDRLRPGWQAALEARDGQFLDALIEDAVAAGDSGGAPCGFAAAQQGALERRARRDVAAMARRRVERRRSFDALRGWRVVVEAADGQPLWPRGFDPLNVERIAGGVLHARFVALGNDAGEIRVVDEADADLETLSEGIGPHPLFNGVRRATIAGLARPRIETVGDTVTVQAPGCSVRFAPAVAVQTGTRIVVRLSRLP